MYLKWFVILSGAKNPVRLGWRDQIGFFAPLRMTGKKAYLKTYSRTPGSQEKTGDVSISPIFMVSWVPDLCQASSS
jgi:hypothetical protein